MFVYGEEIIDNIAPVANAGTDKVITLPIDTVALSGIGTDLDGTISDYLWSYASGPSDVTLEGGSTANAIVRGLVQGVYVFQFTVTDNDGATHIDFVQVTVNAAIPPAPSSKTIRTWYRPRTL
jgi:hypothetical protein